MRRSKNKPGTEAHLIENTVWVDGPLDTPCRVWTKATTKAGYGVIGTRPKLTYAHRLAYEIEYGAVPDKHVCHRCDVPACTATDHLFAGTDQDNVDDMVAKSRDRKSFKLTDEQLQDIKIRLIAGETHQAIADIYNVTRTAVSRVAQGKRRTKNVR